MTTLSLSQNSEAADTGSTRSLRIAVIGSRGVPSNYSGVERIVEDLFEFAAALGHKITVYCRPGVLATPTGSHKRIRLVRAPAPGGKNFQTLSHSLASTIHAVTRGDIHDGGKRFDLISYHTLAPGLFTPIANVAGVPVISHVHGLDWQREKWRGLGSAVLLQCERTMVRHATHIIGVNPDIVDYYRTRFGREVEMLPNGVHKVRDDFVPDAAVLAGFGLTPKSYAVCVGRLVPEKRIHDTIAAFKRVPGEVKLAFVGEGKHSPEYVERIRREASADPRIVFTGLQTGVALETLFRSARMYITASELEGLPSSLLECMERRVPAIVSDITPHRQLLGNVEGYDGFFKVGDIDGLVSQIAQTMNDEGKAQRMARAAREFVREHYSWPALAIATLKRYQQVVSYCRAERERRLASPSALRKSGAST